MPHSVHANGSEPFSSHHVALGAAINTPMPPRAEGESREGGGFAHSLPACRPRTRGRGWNAVLIGREARLRRTHSDEAERTIRADRGRAIPFSSSGGDRKKGAVRGTPCRSINFTRLKFTGQTGQAQELAFVNFAFAPGRPVRHGQTPKTDATRTPCKPTRRTSVPRLSASRASPHLLAPSKPPFRSRRNDALP